MAPPGSQGLSLGHCLTARCLLPRLPLCQRVALQATEASQLFRASPTPASPTQNQQSTSVASALCRLNPLSQHPQLSKSGPFFLGGSCSSPRVLLSIGSPSSSPVGRVARPATCQQPSTTGHEHSRSKTASQAATTRCCQTPREQLGTTQGSVQPAAARGGGPTLKCVLSTTTLLRCLGLLRRLSRHVHAALPAGVVPACRST